MYKNAQEWTCKYCNRVFRGRRNLFKHLKECDEKHKFPHNKLGKIIVPGIGKKQQKHSRKKY